MDKIQNIRHYSRQLIREFGFLDYRDLEHSLTLPQVHALIEISLSIHTNVKDLSQKMILSKSAVSRVVKDLQQRGFIDVSRNNIDTRFDVIKITQLGKVALEPINKEADNRVKNVLENLSLEEQEVVEKGVMLYQGALKETRILREFTLRKIEKEDNIPIKKLIVSILKEYGADREGFAFSDVSLNAMYETYQVDGGVYFVIEKDHKILGGAGISPLIGEENTAELQKMYFHKKVRGKGLGQILIKRLSRKAKEMGYKKLYLETLSTMNDANKLYFKSGFKLLNAPLGRTGHFGCDHWYLKDL
jgi:putative acetyltransferase